MRRQDRVAVLGCCLENVGDEMLIRKNDLNELRITKITGQELPLETNQNVAGVAALIRSYYPKLSAKQVKHILMDSGIAITTDVIVGGKANDVRSFTALSKSGKIVNAYNALLMGERMSK